MPRPYSAPVAPPRLVNVGMVDTAALYHQSVYAVTAQLGADQYAAMPSVHVAWAGLVAIAVIMASRSRWRWLILLHIAATLYVVAATANHFWLDGVVAFGLLGISLVIQEVSRRISLRATRAISSFRTAATLDITVGDSDRRSGILGHATQARVPCVHVC